MVPERSARLTRLRPEYRRFIARVLVRLRAPRSLRRTIAAQLRAALEQIERQGATPAGAVAAMGDVESVAGHIRAKHPFRPLPERRRALTAGACACGLVAAAAALVHVRATVGADRPPEGARIGEVASRGVWAGASVIGAADLQDTGQPWLVGTNAEGGRLWVVAWSVGTDGSVRTAGAVPLAHGDDVATRIVPGRYLPGSGQQAAIFVPDGQGATVYLVGWRNGGPVVLGTSPMPAVSIGTAAAGASAQNGPDNLFIIGPANTLQSWAWDAAAGRFALAATAALDPAPGAVPQGLAIGRTNAGTYVAAFLDPETPYACSGGSAGTVEVFQTADLRSVWDGALGGQPIQGLGADAPDGPLLALADGQPGDAGARIERWNGQGWTEVGTLACGLRIIGTAPNAPPDAGAGTAIWLASDGPQLARVDASGQVVGSAAWPFQGDSPFLYYHRWPYVAVGSFVAFADFWRLETARWTGSAWAPAWQAADSATMQPSALLPAARGWDLLDTAGNLYAPSGTTWTWAGQAPPNDLVASWMALDNGAYRPVLSGSGTVRELQLLTPQGRPVYSGALPPGDTAVDAIVPLPLDAHRVDIGVALAENDAAGGPQVPILVLRRTAGGALRPVARLSLPVPSADAVVGSPYVLPGSGRVEIVLPFMPAEGAELGMRQQVAAVWTGRTLRPAAAPAPPGALQGFGTLAMADGRWVAVGLVQGAPSASGIELGGAPSAFFTAVPDASTSLLLGRLDAGGVPIWSRIRMPVQPPDGPVRAMPLPDGSGRVLLTVSGRTFVYRLQ